jgi:peroxiredoxin
LLGYLITILGYPAMKNYISFLRNPNPRVWEIPPTITFKNEKGNTVSLAEMKGKTICVGFLVYHMCSLCKKSSPEFEGIRKEYKKIQASYLHPSTCPGPVDKMERVRNFGDHQKFSFQKLYAQDETPWNPIQYSVLPLHGCNDKQFKIRYRGSFIRNGPICLPMPGRSFQK